VSGHLFVISGPSGAGKGTLLGRVVPHLKRVWVAVSATTRQPRTGEIDSVHYNFLSAEEFESLIAVDGLLEWATVHGERYGTPKAAVLEHLAAGDDVILEIDPQGACQVRQAYPQALLLFVAPPSLAELRRRLEARGTESAAAIERRLETARQELEMLPRYDKVIVNDDLEVATAELLAWLQAPQQDTEQDTEKYQCH